MTTDKGRATDKDDRLSQAMIPMSVPDDDEGTIRAGMAVVAIGDSTGTQIGDLNGALNVHITDVHENGFNEHAHQHTGVASTLAVATTGDGTENTIEVAVGEGALFTAGDYIQISNSTHEGTHPSVISIAGDVLTLDRYIDTAHAIGTDVEITLIELNVVGSLAAPVTFIVSPDGGDTVHLHRLIFSMTHATAGDLDKFGGIAAIANGVIIRSKTNGVFATFTNWKTNGDMKNDMYDVDFDARSSGGGSFGTSGRWTIAKVGAYVRLDGALGDQIEVIIQDDLSGLTGFNIKMQGHYDD